MAPEDLIYSQTEAALGTLRAASAQSESPAVSIFIDPTRIDPLGDALRADDSVTCCPLTALERRFPRDKLPYIAHLPDGDRARRMLERSIEQAVREANEIADDNLRPRSVCAWIVGAAQPYKQAHALGLAALVIRPEKQRWPLRYWDPRVIAHLPRVLTSGQYAALRPCLSNWWSLNGGCHLAPAAPSQPDAIGKLPLRFDVPQWQALERIEPINEFMRTAAAWGHAPGPELAKRVDEAMRRAQDRGFPSEQDLRLFAVCALMGHARFDEHPRVAASIERTRFAGETFSAAIGEFEDEFWASLNDGRWLEQLNQGVSI